MQPRKPVAHDLWGVVLLRDRWQTLAHDLDLIEDAEELEKSPGQLESSEQGFEKIAPELLENSVSFPHLPWASCVFWAWLDDARQRAYAVEITMCPFSGQKMAEWQGTPITITEQTSQPCSSNPLYLLELTKAKITKDHQRRPEEEAIWSKERSEAKIRREEKEGEGSYDDGEEEGLAMAMKEGSGYGGN